MPNAMNFVAVDLGASSGRLMVGQWDGRRFSLDELHRFPNSGVCLHGSLYWDALRIWSEIQNGLLKYRARFANPPAGIAVDAWGVDFALLDSRGRLLDNPSHYRDPRTIGIPQRLFQRISEADLYAATGVQSFPYNTLFQLYSMVLSDDPKLDSAETLLMIPDLFNFFLGGRKAVEYTEASTSEMIDPAARDWHRDLLRTLSIPDRILPPVVAPATVLSEVTGDLIDLCGFNKTFPVIAVASHDTASAVASIPNLDAHSAFISSGTWSLMGVELDAPVATPRACQLHFTNEGGCNGSTLLLRNLTGLWLLQECLRQWQLAGHAYTWDDLIVSAAAAQPFRSILYPGFSEFLAPPDMLQAIRAFCQSTAQPIPESVGEFARCCFESLSLSYWSTHDALESLTGQSIHTLRVVGGGCLNAFLCQMTADACGCTVVSGPVEASALGNVMLQAVATGALPNVAAGRACLGESIQCITYTPHSAVNWSDAQALFTRLEAATSEPPME
jgi:rhamnulokinase